MAGSFIEVRDPRFNKLVHGNAGLDRIWTGGRWAEGPAYFPAGKYLIWSDIPNDRLMRWDETSGDVSVFEEPCRNQNGHTVDRVGRLVACEHRGRAVSRIEPDGSRTVLADSFEGKRLNSPNDAVVKSDGSIWFTDPTYGIDSEYEGDAAPSEIGESNVYRIDPADGKITRVVADMTKPNGIAFSPDEKILYVADSGMTHDPTGPHHIRALPVGEGGKLSRGKVFAEIKPGIPDGFRVDTDGNVWTSCQNGVICIDPKGKPLGKIKVPQMVANLTFGGPKRNRLFITATKSLYAIYVAATGAQVP
jgi:gluconolactonase